MFVQTSNSQTATDLDSYSSSPQRPLVGGSTVISSPGSAVVRTLLEEEEEGLGKVRVGG